MVDKVAPAIEYIRDITADRARLRRECDMRADDTLKLCMEIDGLNAKLEAVRNWLKESPMSERISARRCRELKGILGTGDSNA